jgi:hypothetical protein
MNRGVVAQRQTKIERLEAVMARQGLDDLLSRAGADKDY